MLKLRTRLSAQVLFTTLALAACTDKAEDVRSPAGAEQLAKIVCALLALQRIHGTVQNKASVEGQGVDKDFHLYSMEWTPDYIIISYNKVPYFFYRNEGTGWQAWPFDHAYHLILNLAIGGAWGRAGGPIDDTLFPVRMEVDYVRIYQLAGEQNQ